MDPVILLRFSKILIKSEPVNLLQGILGETWYIWNQAAFFLIIGFLFAGFIHAFLSTETIGKYLGEGKFRSVFYAALFGIPLPLCSCGVVPAAMSLKKNGANNGATLSFLISTPVSGVDSIAVTYTLMDWVMMIFRPLSGFVAAMVAGLLENIFGYTKTEVFVHEHPVDGCCHGEKKNFQSKLVHGLQYAFVNLMDDIAGWFLVGMLVAGVISYAIPDSWIQHYLGGGLSSMLVMLVVGIPLYICASASTPIAAALILKGMSPGAALVFLLAGSATNAASITVIGRFLGKRATIIYLATISITAILFGILLDKTYGWLHLQPKALSGIASMLPHNLSLFFSILLLVLMFKSVLKKLFLDI